jgi:diaminohydroxyphosphoribosylaminopyrimidine deaminase / 5-amino-6-(5-phosphoribosylamino)uracil reductase
MKTDEWYIQRCIDLALKGKGNVAPNPMVGAVIVLNDEIIGEGYHEQYGQAHAEVNAVNAVQNKALLKDATIYVSLEPCAHVGKTPPCADLIVQHQFKRVVVGCLDSYSEVSGKGIQRMREHSIQVDVGVMEQECRELNKRFFTFHERKRPYIILKWAQTVDGFMDPLRTNNEKGIYWITHPETKKVVHQWRAEEAAIMVGKNTAIVDNPSLTTREFKGKNPIRILLDSHLETPINANLFNDEAQTLIFNLDKSAIESSNEWIKVDKMDLAVIMSVLHKKNIQSVIVEGGKQILEQFIASNLWDEARVLIGENVFLEGLAAPLLNESLVRSIELGKDRLNCYKNTKI